MSNLSFVELASSLVSQIGDSPGRAAWFQTVASLTTLLAASLIPWLKGRSRQRAFTLRARILVQLARINLIRLERSVDLSGELQDQYFEVTRSAREFKNFPVEELSRKAATSFHECRLAFLNADLSISRFADVEGVLRPMSRIIILRAISTFHRTFDDAGAVFKPDKKNLLRKPSKAELEVEAALLARKPDFVREWKEFHSEREKQFATAADEKSPA